MRKMSIALMMAMFVAGTAAAPALRADDEPKSKDSKKLEDASAKTDKDGDKKDEPKPDPIKRLVEISVDPFLVPARAINVPLPGRVRTAREFVENMEKLAKDDSVGAVLLNMDGLALGISDIERS
mgnify:CR=1 FL=1